MYSQGKLTADDYGRDHHPRAFTIWMAGGGIKPGITLGETDDYGYNITQDPVHIHDLNATILRCLGIDHQRLTYKFQGRYPLDGYWGTVVKKASTSIQPRLRKIAGLSYRRRSGEGARPCEGVSLLPTRLGGNDEKS